MYWKKCMRTAVVLGIAAAFCGCAAFSGKSDLEQPGDMKDVYRFLKDAGVYYLATVDGDQPRVRPFGTVHIFEGKLYIQTGRKKNVSRQLAANGKMELCAMKGGEWIRVSATLVDDNRREAKASMLEEYPALKKMYSPDDDNTQVLYLKDATATIYSFAHDPVIVKF